MVVTLRQSRPRKDGRQRREQVLDEAQRLIGEKGYHGFGLQELASRCGLTKAGLLHHFGTKDQLLIALLRDRDARNAEAVLTRQSSTPSGMQTVDHQRLAFIEALKTIVERSVQQPELVRLQTILRVEAINPGHPAHAYFEAREAGKLDIVAQGVRAFTASPRSTARQIIAVITGLEEQWLREGCGMDLMAEFAQVVTTLLPAGQIAAPDEFGV